MLFITTVILITESFVTNDHSIIHVTRVSASFKKQTKNWLTPLERKILPATCKFTNYLIGDSPDLSGKGYFFSAAFPWPPFEVIITI